jgi:selenide,water dikinase
MTRLSRNAARILRQHAGAVHALTDITGFSLAGHAHEMAHLSGRALRFDMAAIPRLPGAERCALDGMIPGGLLRNAEYFLRFIDDPRELGEVERLMLFDPQTSGGLLAAVDEAAVDRVLEAFRAEGEPVWRIGRALAGVSGQIQIG